MTDPKKFTTGTGEHWGREVRGPKGFTAWCAGPNGRADAQRIAAALNHEEDLEATRKALRWLLRCMDLAGWHDDPAAIEGRRILSRLTRKPRR